MGFTRNIAAPIVLALTLVALGIGYGYAHWEVDRSAEYWVDHAHRLVEATLTVFPEMQDVVTGEHAVLEGGGTRALGGYDRAKAVLRRNESHLGGLTRDDPAQAARVVATNQALETWIAGADGLVEMARQGDAARARDLVTAGALRASIGRARQDTLLVAAAERRELANRIAAARDADRLSQLIALALILVALAGLVGLIVALNNANGRLRRASEETRRSRERRDISEALNEALFANIPDFLMVLNIDDDDRISVGDVNPALAKAFDADRDQVRGGALEDLLPARVAGPLAAAYLQVRDSGAPVRSRGAIDFLPGEPRVWDSIVAPVANAAGKFDRIVGAIRDVTDQTRAEARLRESQRMEAIGQLTGGVAHDFNNLLQVVRGNLELLAPLVENDPAGRRRLEHAILGADRAAGLTAQLLAFARRQPLAPEVIDLAVQARNMSELLRRTLGASIEMKTSIAADLWPTLADPAQVESAILNLALNARAAMPGGGKLTLRVENAVLAEAEAADFDIPGGDFVLIAVTDTGAGMTPEVLARVFEPFFTTKPEGEGTGLGLSMVYGFVRQSRGAIRIDSAPSEGARVRIWLPRSHDAPAEAEPASLERATDAWNPAPT